MQIWHTLLRLWRQSFVYDCSAESEKCCLCGGDHKADYPTCPARKQEVQVLEIMENRRCSLREAISAVKEREHGYASVTARHQAFVEKNMSQVIAHAVEKSVAKMIGSVIGCYRML